MSIHPCKAKAGKHELTSRVHFIVILFDRTQIPLVGRMLSETEKYGTTK